MITYILIFLYALVNGIEAGKYSVLYNDPKKFRIGAMILFALFGTICIFIGLIWGLTLKIKRSWNSKSS